MSRKYGELCPLGESWVPIQHNVAWAEAYLRTKWHLDPSNRLATIHQRFRQDRQTDNGPISYGEPFYKGFARKLYVAEGRRPRQSHTLQRVV